MYGTLVLLHMNCRSRVSSVTLGDIKDVPRIIDNSMFSHSELDAAFFFSVMQSEEEQTLFFYPSSPDYDSVSYVCPFCAYVFYNRLSLNYTDWEWERDWPRLRSLYRGDYLGIWWSPRASRIGTVWGWWARLFIIVSISVPRLGPEVVIDISPFRSLFPPYLFEEICLETGNSCLTWECCGGRMTVDGNHKAKRMSELKQQPNKAELSTSTSTFGLFQLPRLSCCLPWVQ